MFFFLIVLAMQSQVGNDAYRQGVAFFQTGDYDKAIPFFLRAAAQKPRDALAWKALGVVYAAQGRYGLAEEPFRNACRLDAGLEDACYYLARSLYALNRFEASLEALRAPTTIDPKSWKIHLATAQALEALQRVPEAETEFKTALNLSADKHPEPGVAYGLFLIRQGRFHEATAPLTAALNRFPDSAEAHIHLGRALLEEGNLAEAIRHFERAIIIRPDSGQAHLLLGKAYVRAGRADEAPPHFEAAARYEVGSTTVK